MSVEEQPLERTPAPQHVRELADACLRYVAAASGFTLDFAPETLPLLDHYLGSVERKPDVQRLVAAAAGAYFGELVRAQFPCRWHAPADDVGSWRIEFEQVFLHFNPVAFAHEALCSAEVAAGGAGFGVLEQDLDAVRAGLEVLGTVAEDDYFKLTTRLEVLGTVYDRLYAQYAATGSPATSFDEQAYRAALDAHEERLSARDPASLPS